SPHAAAATNAASAARTGARRFLPARGSLLIASSFWVCWILSRRTGGYTGVHGRAALARDRRRRHQAIVARAMVRPSRRRSGPDRLRVHGPPPRRRDRSLRERPRHGPFGGGG